MSFRCVVIEVRGLHFAESSEVTGDFHVKNPKRVMKPGLITDESPRLIFIGYFSTYLLWGWGHYLNMVIYNYTMHLVSVRK